ncbi:MAG: TetR/AcrR family transcriptional regulator [Candidatus Rokuibacteriota bacterium]|nr:MAG: TetR/AcrR family transcriptional regulator [Candidatus Rokubacteria bacterium]
MANLEEIIAAAAKVFRTKGYHAATVQDIADAVGILKGSLYHHFKSKEDLLYLIVKEPIARIYATMADIVASESPPAEKLRRAILAHLEAFDQHYPHLFVALRERDEMKRRFREQFKLSPTQYERCWQQIVREGIKSGDFRPDLDVHVVSYGLLGMLNWLHTWYDPRGRLSVREIADQFSALALAGLARGPRRTRPG